MANRILSLSALQLHKPDRIMEAGDRLRKRARRGFKGYPIATIAFYGPDDRLATKAVVSIVRQEDAHPDKLERWFSDGIDVRGDVTIQAAMGAFIEKSRAKSVVMVDRIIGCPHEEGVHYPMGGTCPQCPFWANRDRWTGEMLT